MTYVLVHGRWHLCFNTVDGNLPAWWMWPR
jgi:hypothetical protein